MSHHTISVEVEDKPGALARVSQMFARRGYNITSLAVGPTERRGVSRLTMRVDCSEHSFEQIEKQMHKLVNVLRITDLPPGNEELRRQLALRYLAQGATVSQRWIPVRRVGLYVPGGLAVYPSSVVMNVVAAQAAGVASIAVTTASGVFP